MADPALDLHKHVISLNRYRRHIFIVWLLTNFDLNILVVTALVVVLVFFIDLLYLFFPYFTASLFYILFVSGAFYMVMHFVQYGRFGNVLYK